MEKPVIEAIESFTPHWVPQAESLPSSVVVIEPACSNGPPSRGSCPGPEIITAAYLYHYVMQAGGTPILTRVDQSGLAEASAGDLAHWAQLVRGVPRAVALTITYDDATGAQAGNTAELTGRSAALAENIRAVFRSLAAGPVPQGGSASRLQTSAGIPAVELPACAAHLPNPGRQTGRPMWDACREDARHLLSGIQSFLAPPAGTNDRRSTEPNSAASLASTDPVPALTSGIPRPRLERLARSLWPEGQLPPEKVGWFCSLFARLSIRTGSLVYFEVSSEVEGDTIVLRGASNAPSVLSGLTTALAVLGVDRIRDEVRILPDRKALGDRLFGVCAVTQALTYNRPNQFGGLQTQLLFGEPVYLLDRSDGYCLVHAADGYWGWVNENALHKLTSAEFADYMRPPRGAVLRDIQADGVQIPRGAVLPLVGAGDEECRVLLPSGSQLALPARNLALLDSGEVIARKRISAALDLLGSPYVFGGRSHWGLDCSGLITNVSARAGLSPARDAWQQALAGSLVATWWHREGLRPGDQVFFLDPTGKIYHTGVAITPTHVIHAAPPGVQIGSLQEGDRLFDARLARDFFMAKRP